MIYIASPYTDLTKRADVIISPLESMRFANVSRYTHKLILTGHCAFSPIVYGHHFSSIYGIEGDHLTWLNFNQEMMDRAKYFQVYMLDGWKDSRGVAFEIEYAKACGLHVNYIAPVL